MKVFISGEVDTKQGIFNDMLSIAEELGMAVYFWDEYGASTIIIFIKEAIKEITGMPFETYARRGRNLNAYFSRLIFAYNAIKFECLEVKELAILLNRSESNVEKYFSKYEIELKSNKEFSKKAKKVNEFLNKNVSQ